MKNDMDLTLLDRFFHITLDGVEDAIFTSPAIELLEPELMDELIRISAEHLKAREIAMAASFVGLSFFNLCASIQLVLASYNRLLDLSLSNVTFQVELHKDHIHGCFKINELRWEDAPSEDRNDWLFERLSNFYLQHMNPIIERAAESADVKPNLIWNQYGARMRFALDYVLENDPRAIVRERFQNDYDFLAHSLPPETFHRRKNPFQHQPRYLDNPYKPGTKMLMRSSCCLWDRREDGVKCYNCPQLLPKDRDVMRQKIETEQRNAK